MGNGTSIGRVRGLGSAKGGVHHWLLQRFTAIGNLISVLFLIVSLVLLPDYSYGTIVEWIARPVPAVMMILLVVTTFWHARLGLQVLVEDYLHDHANKFAAIAALNLAACGGIAFGVFCIVRIALGAHA
ncbi:MULTISPECIES: succinate dehydrogenase, hydrophobic membrane anchor protein [Sphingomonadaceae]|jgi:succinate dehydrogenase / fumarate reductase membrane anchor subunit|uniref:Succinate dehydrogenase hydrophobic membrane anchor subunit n=1 Tax=Novosphingobium resinovorum TaxID=158500 RepID=A0A031K4B2_9SPHN|nr:MULTISPECIES: succinate dehydrogenase, hydrophobic membrane anchor protein [Sphingomonadaceae]AOR76671.1 succinate dehydrogenase, hydrophobic membrane anchor protein [Novosphingobium resinovorum]EJU11359.1 succinate dehydrogenase hydrophobic membrane anchor protein [Sphingomonas sp. LH128]EZP83823.1 Succinate dehydrogenase hydrophobic membrane anchor protein [Novosphingobium resinovorum]MBF7012014.1 succinate dehydrogenase, hydrophobic membrane anchor protein [Novosphingobium sp. HR1a]MEE44